MNTESSLHGGVAQWAIQTPDAIAVSFGQYQLDYATLNQRADQLAYFLQQHGIGPDTPVGVCLPRSPELLVALLGVLKAGGAYLPLDPAYPATRLAFMLTDAQPPVLLSEQSIVLPDTTAKRINLDSDGVAIAQAAKIELPPVSPEQLAYLIYTSGSTGQPKGVMIEHQAIVNHNRWFLETFLLTPQDRILHKTPFSFDASVWELFIPLMTGAQLVIAPPDAHRDAAALVQEIQTHDVTTLQVVPSLLSALLDTSEFANCHSLTRVFCGGEALTPALRDRFLQTLDAELINLYGPTETCIDATFYRCLADEPVVPIGQPITGMQAYVLDETLQPAEEGELYLGGIGLARGYWQRPELTAEKFIDNPFGDGRLYQTGDLVQRLPSGLLAYLGRRDSQIKLRGFRIELGEIEAALAAVDDVREVAVLVHESRLIAYFTATQPIDTTRLRTHLQSMLPEHMLPTVFMPLPAMPLTPSGKIDRNALPAPMIERDASIEFVAPRNAREQQITEIWQDLLGVDTIGIHDDFFLLGGHSLLATQLINRLRESLGVDLSITRLFENPTIAALADLPEAAPIAPLTPVPTAAAYPLTFAQQRLWFLDQLRDGSLAYHIPLGFRLRGTLDTERLRDSLQTLLARHAILRTNFRADDGLPVQFSLAAANLELPVIETFINDLRGLQRHAERLAQQPFDLTHGPLLRACLFRLADDEHVLLLILHHIIFDGESATLLLRELSTTYQGRELPSVALQYHDFAIWQQQLDDAVLQPHLDYWQAQLANSPPLLELPADYPRPPVQSTYGARESFALTAAQVETLQTFSRAHGLTPFMALLGVFTILLHRYTRQTDLVIGAPVANRTRRELETLPGFFTNTLALRLQPEPTQCTADFLQQVRNTALAGYDHQDAPLEKLVELLRPERSLSHAPLFQAMFVWQTVAADVLKLPNIDVTPFNIEQTTAKFDLTLIIEESTSGLTGHFEYSTDLFAAPRIQRMVGHFLTLLNSVLTNAAQPINQLSLLTDEEHQQWRYAWQGETREYPDESIVTLFENQAAHAPDMPAVRFEDDVLSYAELNARANQLAHYLCRQGAQPGDNVAICLPRSTDAIVALLGILKAGAAFVPLDPQHAPAARILQTLIDADAKWLVGEAETSPCPSISLDKLGGVPTDNPLPINTPTDPAYTVYTSGSTGMPKGVIISHRALLNYLHGITPLLELQGAHSFAFVSTFAADLGHTMIFPALTSGGCLHVLSWERLTNPVAMAEYFDRYPIDYLKIVPSHLAALHSPETEQQVLPKRLLIIGGEAASPAWVRHIKSFAGCRILNHYGPSEATVGVLTWPVETVPGDGLPIGKPLPNVRAYILDGALQPCPIGVAGELCLGGDSLADGYRNRAELTADRFIADPFNPGERLYRTGDRTCWLPDGTIRYLGRIDFQVKIRGFRIELEEVEQALNVQAGIAQAAVDIYQTPRGESALRAWLMLDANAPTITELRDALAETLPDYMLPSSFMHVEALPLNPNGKIDRHALADLEGDLQIISNEGEPPTTGLEIRLAELWSELLGFKEIHRNDDFFALGGHSLLAMQLLYRLHSEFKIDLPLRTLFEAPTLRALASAVNSAQASSQPALAASERPAILPLSFAQQRLWFLDQLDPNTAVYNIPVAWRIHGQLDISGLRAVLNQIVSRHEILHTIFQANDGIPSQVIEPSIVLDIPLKDLRTIPATAREAFVETRLHELAGIPFDLSVGPLCRAEIMRLSPGEHILFFMAHHTVFDGRSFKIFQRELSAFLRGQTLPPLNLQYADYALWQRQLSYDSQLAYWRDILGGQLPILDMPLDKPRPPEQKLRGAVETTYASPELIGELIELGRHRRATLFMVLLSGFFTLLHRYTSQIDLCIGTPVANRNASATEELIGFFVNTVVIRADLSGAPTFNDLLSRIRERCLGAFNHQDLPFEQLVEALQPVRDMSRTPIFQAFFAFQQDAFRQEFDVDDLHFSPITLDSGVARTDLSFWLNLREDGLEISLEYDSDLFTANTARRLLTHYQTLLESIATEPDQPIALLSFLTGVEHAYLTSVWNETAMPYPHEACIQDLVSQQAKVSPNKTAVQFGLELLTYQELEQRSNQLANYLIEQGVKPGDLVGICIHRSATMLVGLLGILKTGAAYLPLDPEYPAERLSFIISDAGVKTLLAESATTDNSWSQSIEHVITLDSDWPAIAATQSSTPTVTIAPERLAYVIYTSGSTGKPKGVQVPHRAVVNFLTGMADTPGMGANDTLVAVTTLSFDIAVLELFLPLSVGGKLVIAERDIVADGYQLRQLLQDAQATMMQATPTTWRILITAGWLGSKKFRALCGGEAFPGDLLAPLSERTGELWNMYGPTETTIWSTCQLLHPNQPINIGRPIANTLTYVLDSHRQLLPVGVPGELYIGGDGVTYGYLNRPELTTERFVPDPFSNTPGATLYKTGDLVCRHADGSLEYLNRIDNQVKVRGFRIELGEIETILTAHPHIQQCTVIVREDQPGDQRLTAYVVLDAGETLTATDMRRHLRKQLPEYMIPQQLMELERLPLTPNGKINRQALPAPFTSVIGNPTQLTPPTTENEQLVAAIWRDLLNIESIGRESNFFELGGHSLLSIQATARIESQTGIRLNPRVLLLDNLGQLAMRLSSNSPDAKQRGQNASWLQRLKHFFQSKSVE